MNTQSQGPDCGHGYTAYNGRHPNGKPCTNLVDATPLGLVDVGSHTVFPAPADRAAIEDYLRNYRPGGPMGPMRESPYRDWPPR